MRTLTVATGLSILLASGLVQGRWTNRWVRSEDVARAVERLARVPKSLGDWEGVDLKTDPRQFEQAEADGYLVRRYVSRQSGEEVTLMIICGRPGPIATHPPDVCYRGAGFEPKGEPVKVTGGAGGPGAGFWVAEFAKRNTPVPEALRIFWGWNASGTWQAADSPRLSYARYGALYKMYVIRMLSAADRSDGEVCRSFLRAALPAIDATLFPPRVAAQGPTPATPQPARDRS